VARYLDYTTPIAPAAPVPADCASVPAILTQTTAGLPSPVAATCVTAPTAPDVSVAWHAFVGDRPEETQPRNYPSLPPLPPYTRVSVNQATVGSCRVYFPGQYNAPLTLASGDHYFASGIYYFTDLVTLQPGARVVGGQGKFDGCAVDAEAVFATDAPKAHSVTGRGATFVFGGAGRLVSNDASLRMNKRISDTSTRGSEFTAFRSVNFNPSATPPPAAPAPVEIPDDLVMIADTHDAANPKCTASTAGQPCMQAAREYTSQASADAPVLRYTRSSLGVNDTIISVTQTGGSSSSNGFEVDGYTFVPNARVLLNGGNNTDYRTRVDGGIVASSIELQYNQAPSVASNWFFGVRETNLEQRFRFYANVDAGNGQRTVSRATLQVDESGNYAINGWTVDPNAPGASTTTTTTTTTTVPETTTTTTVPETTTTTTTVPPTTTTTAPPTTTTTTAPPATVPSDGAGNCNLSNPGGWSRDFGPGTWKAEFWNLSSFSGVPGTPFPASGPAVTTTVTNIDLCSTGSPPSGVNSNHFTARFTKTYTLTAPQTVRLLAGGDDGYRVFINGTSVLDGWVTQSHIWRTSTVNLPAGTHTIVFEFFERDGQASYQLWRN
jgi:hypothetical protein